jgi:hypothetical protein
MIKQKPASPSALDKLKETYFEVGVARQREFSKLSERYNVNIFI